MWNQGYLQRVKKNYERGICNMVKAQVSMMCQRVLLLLARAFNGLTMSRRVTGAAFGRHPRSTSGSDPRAILAAAASQNFVSAHHLSLRLAPYQTAAMARTKERQTTHSGKRGLLNDDPFSTTVSKDRPAKKAKLLDDSDNSDAEEGGVTLKVNDEYARRFEYNKKREEKHRRMSHVRRDCNIELIRDSGGKIRQG
jgi:hypothetical protein